MLTLSTTAAFLAGSVMALWLAASAWALATGLNLQRRVSRNSDQADRLAILLDGAPASPLIIRQNGRVDARDQARALDRFSRAGAQAADVSGRSLGLGLPLARQYVEGHGGTLNLISELGLGTAVQIELPRT
jgi:light-regulated signal transduction histidine kinase (bacteriophytochrome)